MVTNIKISSLALFVILLGGTLAVSPIFGSSDGTVESFQKISSTEGEFSENLDAQDTIGRGLTSIGDLDGDGIPDLAAGSIDDDGGTDRGAVWILFLNSDGTVKSEQKISNSEGNLGNVLGDTANFGSAVGKIGDLDNDGVIDIAVGAPETDDGGLSKGAVWILFLNSDGTVKDKQKISETSGGFGETLDEVGRFGQSLRGIDDLNGDGIPDILVGAPDDDGGLQKGVFWIIFLNTDETVKSFQKISETEGGFSGEIDDGDFFSFALTPLGDLDRNGALDLAVSASGDDDGGVGPPDGHSNRGAIWILFMNDANAPPICSNVIPVPATINKPNQKMIDISLVGIEDMDGDDVSLTITSITQDEPTSELKHKDKSPDGVGVGTDKAQVRAERDIHGNGRVYEISFEANDGNGGMCSGYVDVLVPKNKKTDTIDDGQNFDSTLS